MSRTSAMTPPTVWLSYVAYPVTTAVYLERALRSFCRVVTLGPPMPPELVERWHLQEMKAPPLAFDLFTEPSPDMGEILRNHPTLPAPDLFVWVESVPGHLPRNLDALPCPTACWLIDTHLNGGIHRTVAPLFDHVFVAQLGFMRLLADVAPRLHWLPLACDPEIHRRWRGQGKRFDVGFVGGVIEGSRRESLLKELSRRLPVAYRRCFWDEMAQHLAESRIVFNSAVNDDLNMRVFEAMSVGSLLLTDRTPGSGQKELFRDGEEYALYTDETLVETATFYLENERLRERIAARGRRVVHNAHTYLHRARELVAVSLGEREETSSPQQLRDTSLQGIPPLFEEVRRSVAVKGVRRSFVIPVLDDSPASEYNIHTLLADLERIEGEVIVVFNGEEIGQKLRHHPRITRYALMKQNVGVSRGWNVGVEMAESDTVFILNADLHLTPGAIPPLEEGLSTLPNAACVGPQGSFVNFRLCRDFVYFDKESFSEPIEVDAVSGFFFAVDRRRLQEKGIRFETAYTPCYFEEWDLGFQIRRAGLCCYVIPVNGYDHHWSGTIRALRTIPFMGREETAGEILLKNREYFVTKWREIARSDGNPFLLEGGWKRFATGRVRELISRGDREGAMALLTELGREYPDDLSLLSLARLVTLMEEKGGGR